MKTSKTAITLALTAAMSSAGVALANENPFGMQALDQGYMVADAGTKAKDGKCGEGKCGANKAATKAQDGKCGEGKCGANKETVKAKDGKCGEGKCGANKGKTMDHSQE